MIRLATRILLFVQFLLASGCYWLLTEKLAQAHGVATAALAVCIVLGMRVFITAHNFVISHIFRSAPPGDFRLPYLQRIQLFCSELAASIAATAWQMPFQNVGEVNVPKPVGLPVLLLHGYGCNNGYWIRMSKALRAARIHHLAIDLEPPMGSIDEYVERIHAAVNSLCASSKQRQLIIVGHSMGGLAARAYLRAYSSARIAKVITLGTPHHGTVLAAFGIGRNAQQMLRTRSANGDQGSAWLRALAEAEDAQLRSRFVSIYSHHDNIVAPQTSSVLPGAKNLALHGIGHVFMPHHPHVQSLVIKEILSASATELQPDCSGMTPPLSQRH